MKVWNLYISSFEDPKSSEKRTQVVVTSRKNIRKIKVKIWVDTLEKLRIIYFFIIQPI